MLPWPSNAVAVGVLAALALSQAPPAHTLAITSVNVIDVSATTSATALLTNRTVVITANRITAIGDAGGTTVPAGAQRLDGRGKYLMPGLWDMHAHALDAHEWAFPLFLASGVTGIREMGTFLSYDGINEIRRGVARSLSLSSSDFLARDSSGQTPDSCNSLIRVCQNGIEGRAGVEGQ